MSTMPPPPPVDPSSPTPYGSDNFAQIESGPPPWSASAVTGFVASCLICVPVVSSLVGLVAGIMGISSTSGGRRRGRGLAIAAIPISLVNGAVWGFGIAIVVMGARAFLDMQPMLQEVFKARTLDDARLQEIIDEHMSALAATAVTPEKIRQWVEAVVADKGSLAEIGLDVKSEPVPGTNRTVLIFPCRFVNGPADLRVKASVSFQGGFKFLIEDIKVGEHSLRDRP